MVIYHLPQQGNEHIVYKVLISANSGVVSVYIIKDLTVSSLELTPFGYTLILYLLVACVEGFLELSEVDEGDLGFVTMVGDVHVGDVDQELR